MHLTEEPLYLAFNPIRPNDRLGFNLSNICYTVIGNVVDDMWLVNTVVHVVPIHINRLSHSIHIGKRTYAQLLMAELHLPPSAEPIWHQ